MVAADRPGLSPRHVHAEVRRLLALSVDATVADAVEGGLLALSASELVQADGYLRDGWYDIQDDVAALTASFDAGQRSALWLASMCRDGYLRERAVVRLAFEQSPLADRLLALRTADHVRAVQLRAWDALARRCSLASAQEVGPLLLVMARRQRGADGLQRYARLVWDASGEPLWAVLRDSPDRLTHRWAMGRWLAETSPAAAQVVDALAAERDQVVVANLTRYLAATPDAATLSAMLESRHPVARASALDVAPAAWLDDTTVRAFLLDRASSVRSSALFRAQQRGLDARAFYLDRWLSMGEPRALRGAIDAGATFNRDELRALLDDPRTAVRVVALRALAREAMEPQDIAALLMLLDDPAVARAAMRALAVSPAWNYADASGLWAEADPIKRRRLWRLLSSRGGWDRVRASLLAASATDPAVSGQGRADLFAWLQHAAASMYRQPTTEQRRDLIRHLATADIPHRLREAIEFRAGVPVTPRPAPQWTTQDAQLLLALKGRGWLALRGRTVSHAFATLRDAGQALPSQSQTMISIGRLIGSGLVIQGGRRRLLLTALARRVVDGLDDPGGDSLAETLQRMSAIPVDEDPWWLPGEVYLQALSREPPSL